MWPVYFHTTFALLKDGIIDLNAKANSHSKVIFLYFISLPWFFAGNINPGFMQDFDMQIQGVSRTKIKILKVL